MDLWNWKWIVIAVAVIAALLLLVRPPFPVVGPMGPTKREAEILERGSFVLQQQGQSLGREEFVLEQGPNGAVRLASQMTLTLPSQRIEFELELRLNADLEPLSYSGRADTPQGRRLFGAEIDDHQARLYARVGSRTQEKTVSSERPFVFLDNNQNGQLLILYRLVKDLAEGEEAQFTVLVPQVLASFPLRAKRAGPVTIEADGKQLEGEKFSLIFVGGVFVEMYVYDGKVIGSRVPSQEAIFYRSDLFPEGFQVREARSGPTEAQLPPGVREIELDFTSEGLRLAGTLALPEKAATPVPGVLMIHGSGPADRDENVPGMKIDFFRAVAHRLAQAGIASFRYDKRGVGASEGDLAKAGLTDLVEDARAALDALRARREIDPGRVFILGHSEGGNIAPLLAVGDPAMRGLILVATNAHPLDWIIRRQVETLNRAAGLSESELEALLKQQDEWAAFVKGSAGDWEEYPYEKLKERLPWLTPEKYAEFTRVSLRWLREHFTRDPLETIRRVKVPVLLLQGDKDLQVPKEEAELLARTLREAGNKEVELHVLPDLNHLMRRHPEEPNLQDRHLDEPVDERVLQLIVEWTQAHSKSD